MNYRQLFFCETKAVRGDKTKKTATISRSGFFVGLKLLAFELRTKEVQ